MVSWLFTKQVLFIKNYYSFEIDKYAIKVTQQNFPKRILKDHFFFRYLTPIECERLQTIPANCTIDASKTQR